MFRRRYLITLIAIATLSLFWYVPKYGLIYDGGLYASLGRSLSEKGTYVFNGAPGDVPPFFSVLLALFIMLFGEGGIFYVVPLMTIVFITSIYLLLEREFEPSYAFLGTLLLLFSPPIFFYAVNVVRDIPLLTLVILVYFVYLEMDDLNRLLYDKFKVPGPLGRGSEVILGILIAFAFLTKYVAIIYMAPIFIHAAVKRRRLEVPIATALILVLPWSIWSYFVHGTPLVSHSSYLLKEFGENNEDFFRVILPQFIKWSFPPIFLISIPGIIQEVKDKGPIDLYLLLLVITILTALFWPVKDSRYLFLAYPPIIYFALKFLSNFRREHVLIFLTISLLFQGYSTHNMMEANKYSNILFEESGHWLRENTPEGARILTQSHRQVNYFSRRMTFQPPRDQKRVEKFIKVYDTSYAVVDTYEKVTPVYAYTYFDRYELVKTFKDHSHEIKIYNLSRPI